MGLGHSANCIFSSWWVQKLSWVGVSAWSILFDSRFDSKYFVTSYSREGRGFPFLINSKSIWRFRKVWKTSWLLRIQTQTMHIMVEDRDTDNTYYSGFQRRGHSSPTCYSPMELKIDTWISLSCYMDLSKLLSGFV